MSEQRTITYAQALNEAMDLCMKKDPNVFLIGLGVPDPKGVFGSTVGLKEKHGEKRVLDMPVAENGLTGICIGAALRGMRPVMTHQRVDFALLALDQLINNAAKWYFMFGGQTNVPLVVRLIIGRGWGQGAQHSQSLQSIYAHIPGLKVVMPTTAYDAKGLLVSSIEDNNPVICIEHRWLYNLKDHVPEDIYKIPIGEAKVIREGKDLTIVSSSYMTVESLKAASYLEKTGIDVEIIDLRTIKPLDEQCIISSVHKTGRILVADSGWLTGGLAGEVVARVAERAFVELKTAPRRISLPDLPTPSSPGLTKDFYPGCREIAMNVCDMLGKDKKEVLFIIEKEEDKIKPHDVPDLSFTGPF